MTAQAEAHPGAPARSVRPYLGRLWHAWRDRQRLARVRALVPAILAEARPAVAGDAPAGWVVQWSQWSATTGVAVIGIGPSAAKPAAVLKAAYDSSAIAGLRAQTASAEQLWSDPRLSDWRRLVPRTLAAGHIRRLYYTLQTALPGREGQSLDPAARAAVLAGAAAALRPLHRRTAERVVVEAQYLARAVDAPCRSMERAIGSAIEVARAPALVRLQALLRTAILGRTLSFGWVHGDFWLGNVLVGEETMDITGIIDWSMAAPHELALHDPLHLILYARQIERGYELGDAVCEVLAGTGWQPHERAVLAEAGMAGDGLMAGPDGERIAVLLYWLRRVQSIFVQGRGHSRNSVWTAQNIDRVLELL